MLQLWSSSLKMAIENAYVAPIIVAYALMLGVEYGLRQFITHLACCNIKHMTLGDSALLLDHEEHAVAMSCNLSVLKQCQEQIKLLEKTVLKRVQLCPDYKSLRTVPGIGRILTLTIMLETGDIGRFDKAGNFASYARCVDRNRLSNGKKK